MRASRRRFLRYPDLVLHRMLRVMMGERSCSNVLHEALRVNAMTPIPRDRLL